MEIKPDFAEAHNNFGNALAGRGQIDEAIAHYQAVLEIKPDYAEAYNNLGVAFDGQGRLDDAIACIRKALEIKPEYHARENLDVALSNRERILKALDERREALRLHPNDAALLNDTAWMLATNPNASIRNGAEAVELAERALKLSVGNEPAVLDTLAAAYAEAGRFPEAIATANKALDSPPNEITRRWPIACVPDSHCTKPASLFIRRSFPKSLSERLDGPPLSLTTPMRKSKALPNDFHNPTALLCERSCAWRSAYWQAVSTQAAESRATAEYLRCEYRVDPLGIDVVEPRFSWEMHDARRGAKQTAYQILVASTPEKLAADEADLWDSGRVASDQSTQVVYAGKPLASRMQCHWKVRLWDADGHSTAYSKPAMWSMGLLKPEDVQAQWIGTDAPMVVMRPTRELRYRRTTGFGFGPTNRASRPRKRRRPGLRYFRRSLTIPQGKVIRKATFALAADNSWKLFVNGVGISGGSDPKVARELNVAPYLNSGDNCLAITATGGPRPPAGLTGKLVVEFEQGEPLVLLIDGSWKSAVKRYDDWNAPAFDDSKWPAAVQIAKLGDSPWGKIRIAEDNVYYGCALLRKEFKVPGDVRRATVYGSALGIYRLHINGRPVGDDYFTPDWTDYRKRVYYNTYDVTELVRKGDNAIGGILGSGWYAGGVGGYLGRNHYGDRPRLLAQLEIELADGTIQTIVTDDSWKTAYGPYLEAEFLAGETYDARRRIPGWDSPGLDDGALEARGRDGQDSVQARSVSRRQRPRDRRAASGQDHAAEAEGLRFRHGPELRRIRAAEGPRPRRHESRASFRRGR